MIDFSVDEPGKEGKTLLVPKATTKIGQPTFVARLIPMFLLKADFLFDQIIYFMNIIHDRTRIVTASNVIKIFYLISMLHKNYDSARTYSMQHQIANEDYDELFVLYNLFHLLKYIRNNWCTEICRCKGKES